MTSEQTCKVSLQMKVFTKVYFESNESNAFMKILNFHTPLKVMKVYQNVYFQRILSKKVYYESNTFLKL